MVVRLTAYLFVWMSRRRAGVACCLPGECLRIAEASSVICFWSLTIGFWFRMSVFLLFWCWLCWWDFTHMLRLKIYLGDVFMMYMTWLFGDVCYLSVATFLRIFFIMHVLITIEDVTSISWIFVLFACFIALIEAGRYKILQC